MDERREKSIFRILPSYVLQLEKFTLNCWWYGCFAIGNLRLPSPTNLLRIATHVPHGSFVLRKGFVTHGGRSSNSKLLNYSHLAFSFSFLFLISDVYQPLSQIRMSLAGSLGTGEIIFFFWNQGYRKHGKKPFEGRQPE